MTRPSIERTMLDIAEVLARRATCTKLAVGCVFTNLHGQIVGSGYNGVVHGMPHCTTTPCRGSGTPSGSGLCVAVHAEMNALISCADPYSIHTCYTTHAPCLNCAKVLLNTGCQRIVYTAKDFEPAAKELWVEAGCIWEQFAE